MGVDYTRRARESGYWGTSEIPRFLTGAPSLRKRAQPCQLFTSLITLRSRTFRPFFSVTSLRSLSFSSVRVSATPSRYRRANRESASPK